VIISDCLMSLEENFSDCHTPGRDI